MCVVLFLCLFILYFELFVFCLPVGILKRQRRMVLDMWGVGEGLGRDGEGKP